MKLNKLFANCILIIYYILYTLRQNSTEHFRHWISNWKSKINIMNDIWFESLFNSLSIYFLIFYLKSNCFLNIFSRKKCVFFMIFTDKDTHVKLVYASVDQFLNIWMIKIILVLVIKDIISVFRHCDFENLILVTRYTEIPVQTITDFECCCVTLG